MAGGSHIQPARRAAVLETSLDLGFWMQADPGGRGLCTGILARPRLADGLDESLRFKRVEDPYRLRLLESRHLIDGCPGHQPVSRHLGQDQKLVLTERACSLKHREGDAERGMLMSNKASHFVSRISP